MAQQTLNQRDAVSLAGGLVGTMLVGASLPTNGDTYKATYDEVKAFIFSAISSDEVINNSTITGANVTNALDNFYLEYTNFAALKGQPNCLAELDGSGVLPLSQTPVGVMRFLGSWDASTNTPTLTNGTGNQGDSYSVSVAGTVDFGSGAITFAVSDWVLYNGSEWEKRDNTDQVSSVFVRIGAVTAQAGDYNTDQVTEASNLYYTQARFNSAFTAKSTTDLAEGTNLYHTTARVQAVVTKTYVENLGIDYASLSGEPWTVSGNDISNNNTGDVFINTGLNIKQQGATLNITDEFNNVKIQAAELNGSGGFLNLFNEAGVNNVKIRSYEVTGVSAYFNAGNVAFGKTTASYQIDSAGDINTDTLFRVGGAAGVSGTFTTADAKTVTVTGGIITSIV